MNDDEILILLFLLQNEGVTTTEIAKALFVNNNNSKGELNREQKNKREVQLRNSDRRVRYYLSKFAKGEIVNVKTVGGKKRFSINTKNVHFGLGKIDMTTFEGNEVSFGLGKILLCKVKDGVIIEPTPDLELD